MNIQAVSAALRQRKPCIVCGSGEVVASAIFFPDNSQRFGAPDGKERMIFYALCERCYARKDRNEAVEKRIEGDVKWERASNN